MKKLNSIVVIMIIITMLLSISVSNVFASNSNYLKEVEDNDTIAKAQSVQVNTDVSGTLGDDKGYNPDSTDFYKVVLTDNGVLHISMTKDAALESVSTTIQSSGGAGYAYFQDNSSTDLGLGFGTYYIGVQRNSGKGSYTLGITFSKQGLQTDAEPNNKVENAQTLSLNSATTGNIGYLSQAVRESGDYDNNDMYKIVLPSKGKLNLTLSYDASIKAIRTGISNGNGSGYGSFDNSGSNTFELNAGTYYIELYNSNFGFGGYTLKNSFTSSTAAATPAPIIEATPAPAATPTPSDDTGESDDILTSLVVTPSNIVLDVGKTLQFKASASYSSGSIEEATDFVEWSPVNKKIVTVDENGLLRAVGPGSTQVLAKLEGKSYMINVTVNPVVITKMVSKITIQRATLYLKVGQQGSNATTCLFSDKTKQDITSKATLTSSNKSIVAIYRNGYFKAMKAGSIKIQVEYKGVKTSFNVVVK